MAWPAATGTRLSVSEVGRILRFEQLRPHRIRQWLHSPDPDFVEKAERVCAQYLEPPAEAVVVCVDEKPLVIRSGKYPTRVGRGAVLRREFEYRRHGTATLFAAFAPRTGHVFGRVEADRTARTLVGFMEQLAAQYPTGPVSTTPKLSKVTTVKRAVSTTPRAAVRVIQIPKTKLLSRNPFRILSIPPVMPGEAKGTSQGQGKLRK